MNAEAALTLGRDVLSESLLLERLFMASVELTVLAGFVWLLERWPLQRRPRVAALLWVVVLGNATLSLAFDAPVSFAVLEHSPEMKARGSGGDPAGPGLAPGVGAAEAFLAAASTPGVPSSDDSTSDGAEAGWFQGTLAAARSAGARPDEALVCAWLAGVGLFVLMAARDRRRLWRLLRDSEEPSERILERYRSIGAEEAAKRIPRLRVTRTLDSPAIVGAFRATILMPAWIGEEGRRNQLDWALRHELTHAQMGDPLANALSQFMRTLYFFHPVAWWAGRRWKAAMELACDHAMVGSEAEAREYASALHAILASIRSQRRPGMSCGLFAVSSQVGRRVAMLARMPVCSSRLNHSALATIVAFAAVALTIGARIAPAAQALGATPDPKAILDTYTRAQDRIQAFTVHYAADLTTHNQLHDQFARANGRGQHVRDGWFTQDFRGRRFLEREHYWSPSRGETRGGAHFRLFHWDGQTYYQYMGKGGRGTIGREGSDVARTNREHPLQMLSRAFLGKDLLGYPIQSEQRLDQMLRGAQLRLLPGMEYVGRFRCHAIEADTRFGLITAWFDPQRECSLVKYVIRQGEGDYYKGAEIEVTVREFERVDGLWMPAAGHAREDWRVLDGGFIRRETTVRMDSFSINPDLDKDGTFELTRYVENGSEWFDSDAHRTQYIWRNGDLVPVR